MTRSEFALVLLDLVQRNAITPVEMVEVLRRFDAGDLDEDDLPLATTPTEAAGDDNWTTAAALLYILLSASPTRLLSSWERERARKLLRLNFEASMVKHAATVTNGKTIERWHAGVANDLGNYTRTMTVAGAGTLPGEATKAKVEQRLATQWPYLLAFGIQIAVRRIGKRDMSEAWIAQRSRQYGASGWGAYFVGQGDDASYGYVDRWNTRDDHIVCRNCRPRHNQLFLPAEGPYPGWDCLGDCRCERVPEYNPSAYSELTNN